MSLFTSQPYDVILGNRYYLRELVESISLEESLGEISYRANIGIVATPDLPAISPGQEIAITGIPFGGSSMASLLHPGVVWEVQNSERSLKQINITAYDRTIYLAKSEDEYLFPEGQTATQRIKRYASDWGISTGEIAETGVVLAKAVHRAKSIYSMIMADLKETAAKGGGMFRPRMTEMGLDLFELGSNKTVWMLEADQNLEEITERRTLDEAVTQVVVLGKESKDKLSPVLAVVKGETVKYGTLQKVLRDDKIKNSSQANKTGKNLLSGESETISVKGLDINTIRAGDKVRLKDNDLLVTSVRHELGSPGNMSLELATTDYVRRKFYVQSV